MATLGTAVVMQRRTVRPAFVAPTCATPPANHRPSSTSPRRSRRPTAALAALVFALATPVPPGLAQPVAVASVPISSLTESPRGVPRALADAGRPLVARRIDPLALRDHALVTYHIGRAAEREMLWRLCVAIACGAIIGMERRAAAASAGVRTLALVALGAAVFTLTALLSASGNASRMGAAVSTGIGFLGAGAIHQDSSQRHLVTAASVWIAAALGVAAASGLKFLALIAALTTVAILRWGVFTRYLRIVVKRRWPALSRQVRAMWTRQWPAAVPVGTKKEQG